MIVREEVADKDENTQTLDDDGTIQNKDEQLLQGAEAEDGSEPATAVGHVVGAVEKIDVAGRLHL